MIRGELLKHDVAGCSAQTWSASLTNQHPLIDLIFTRLSSSSPRVSFMPTTCIAAQYPWPPLQYAYIQAA